VEFCPSNNLVWFCHADTWCLLFLTDVYDDDDYSLGRIAAIARRGLLLQTEQRGLFFCLLSPAETAEMIEMPFEAADSEGTMY